MIQLSEQTKIEAQIGGLIGTMIGMVGVGIVIIGFTNMSITFKIFSIIGFSGSLFMMLIQLIGLFQFRKQFLDAKKIMEGSEISEVPLQFGIPDYVK